MMARQLLLVTLLTGLSQLAAFFKLWFTARIFGVGSELDGYNLALVVPTLVAGISAGFIQTGFFPLRARLHARGDIAPTEALERGLLWCCAALGGVFAVATALATPWLADLLTPHNLPAAGRAFTLVMPYAAALIALNMVCDYLGYLLVTRGLFAVAAGAPVVNGITGALLLAAWPQGGLYCLIFGTLAGTSAQLAICLFALRHRRFALLGALPERSAFLPQLRDMLALGAWVLPGVCFSNIVASLPPVWVGRFGDGAVSAFGYAYRLHSSVVQLLLMASSTLILAHFSDLVAAGNRPAIRRMLRTAAAVSCGAGLAAMAAVWCLGEPLLGMVFGGRFDATAASRVTSLWSGLTVGLGFALLGNVFAKLWQAQSRPKLITAMAAASLAGLCIAYYSLRPILGELSVAIGLSASAAAVVLLGIRYLEPRPAALARP
ncbi:MAG: hypothetical protein JNJ60_09515 [Rhodocyclaceae bacterium]|nr:hypothetical protein [Rhodocyclaceae bacterium]